MVTVRRTGKVEGEGRPDGWHSMTAKAAEDKLPEVWFRPWYDRHIHDEVFGAGAMRPELKRANPLPEPTDCRP